MDTKGNELNSTRRTEEHDTRGHRHRRHRGTPEEQKKTRKGSVKNGRNKKHRRPIKTN